MYTPESSTTRVSNDFLTFSLICRSRSIGYRHSDVTNGQLALPVAVAIDTMEAGRHTDLEIDLHDLPLCRAIADNRFPNQESHDVSLHESLACTLD